MQKDLFNNGVTLRDKYRESLGDWVDKFEYKTLEKLQTTLKHVRDDSLNYKVYPDRKNVFSIYRDCPIDKVRVVLILQDPYFNGNANGYALGCKTSASPSLKQVIKAMESTCEKTGIQKNISLQYLVEQGVFLLNTILTVRANAPLSHGNMGWQSFTRDTIELLNKKEDNIVWLLWGSKAREYKKYISNLEHKVLECEHPVSASYNNTDWNCNHFMQTNEFFKSLRKPKINWI